MSAQRLGSLLVAAVLCTRSLAQTCVSYGIDFQNGGSYFQNISSSDPFTFVSIFEGCDDDVANNILVDTNGDEYQCSNTTLQPDDTNQMSTCPLNKNQLWSGDWSVLIISNNAGDDPIAYERDFFLNVGVPATSTYTPTVTLSSTTTPISSATITTTSISVITLSASTTTVASLTLSPTITVTPSKVTSISTRTIGTIRKTAYVVLPIVRTTTRTATCSIPPTQSTPDPTATISPTCVTAAALATHASKSKYRRMYDRSVPVDREQRIAERKARREAHVQKRAPDASVVVVTDTNPSDFSTLTATITAPATTISTTDIVTVLSTSTPAVVTIQSGKTTVIKTVTAATPTKVLITQVLATSTVRTITNTQTVVVTSTMTPSRAASVCTAKGGHMK